MTFVRTKTTKSIRIFKNDEFLNLNSVAFVSFILYGNPPSFSRRFNIFVQCFNGVSILTLTQIHMNCVKAIWCGGCGLSTTPNRHKSTIKGKQWPSQLSSVCIILCSQQKERGDRRGSIISSYSIRIALMCAKISCRN